MSDTLRIAICQLECHPALHIGTAALVEEPFLLESSSLAKLRAAGLPVDDLQHLSKESYIPWQCRRVAGVLDALASLDRTPDLVIFPEGSIPVEGLPVCAAFSATTGATVLAGTHTVRLSADALKVYKDAGLVMDVREAARSERWTSVLPAFVSGVLTLVPKTGLSPFEMTSVQTVATPSSPWNSRMLRIAGRAETVFPLICSEALQEPQLPKKQPVSVVGILSYDAKPSQFRAFIETQVANRRFVAYCNDGLHGGSRFEWSRDHRQQEVFFELFPSALPPGDAVLIYDVDTSVRAVEVGTAVPSVAVKLAALWGLAYASGDAKRFHDETHVIRELADPALRAAELSRALGAGWASQTQKIKFSYLAQLDRRGVPSRDAWHAFGEDLILGDIDDLKTIESRLAERCLRGLHEKLPMLDLNKESVTRPFLAFQQACASRAKQLSVAPNAASGADLASIVGREAELAQFEAFLNESRSQVLEVSGLPEIGKSSVTQLALAQAGLQGVFYLPIHPGASPDYLIYSLIHRSGSGPLPPYDDALTVLQGNAFARSFIGLSAIVITGVEHLYLRDSWREPVFEQIVARLFDCAEEWNVKIILESRTFVPLNSTLLGRRHRLRVFGLAREKQPHGIRLLNIHLRRVGLDVGVIPDEDKGVIVDRLGGHPVAIALAAEMCGQHGVDTLRSTLAARRGFFMNYIEKLAESLALEDVEKDALALFARTQGPVPQNAIYQAFPDLPSNTIASLIALNAVHVTTDGLVGLADVLREVFVRRHLPAEVTRRFHEAAHAEFERLARQRAEMSVIYRVESAYHGELAGKRTTGESGLLDSSILAAQQLLDLQDFDGAATVINRIMQVKDSITVRRLAALTEASRGNFDRAIAHAEHVFAQTREDTQLLFELGKIALNLYQEQPGIRLVEMARAANLETDAVRTVEGRLYLRQRRYSDAIRVLTEAKKSSVNNPWPYYYLGEAFLKVGSIADAVGVLEEGERFYLGGGSTNRAALVAIQVKLCIAYITNRDLDLAREKLEEILADHPDEAQPLRAFGLLLKAEGATTQSYLDELQNARGRSREERSQLELLLGEEFVDKGELQLADRHFDRACRIDVTNLYARLRYARFCLDALQRVRDSDRLGAKRWLDHGEALVREVLQFDQDNAFAQHLQDVVERERASLS